MISMFFGGVQMESEITEVREACSFIFVSELLIDGKEDTMTPLGMQEMLYLYKIRLILG